MHTNKPARLRFKTETYPAVPHALTGAAGIFSAYHNLFLPIQIPDSAFTGSIQSIEKYYEALSRQRGESLRPPESAIRQLGQRLVEKDDFDSAIDVLVFNTEMHPNIADAHDGLAYAYEQFGWYEHALKAVNKALALSEPKQQSHSIYVNRRDRLVANISLPKR